MLRNTRYIVAFVLILISASSYSNGLIGPRSASAAVTIPNTMSPGTATILIHEYATTDTEMLAFQQGALDIVDWPVPESYLRTWSQTLPGSSTCDTTVPSIVCQKEVFTWTHTDIGMFQIDINSNGSRVGSTLGFRQALGYLVDRQNIVLNFAGGKAVAICAGTAAGQPGAVGCQKLGYSSPYGDYNPSKALQVLYENGWRYSNSTKFLSPPIPFTNQQLLFYIRIDDPIRTQAGTALANEMQTLPNSFTSKTGGSPITVCPTAPCMINVSPKVVDRRTAASVIFKAPWNDWDLYTGGWGLDFDPDH